ncbi:MAG: hypothetical protein HUK03_04205 [Bacteroidaceae bacterium]|nr:hypothetical protein [Bacteroidaceae bacterium]
MKKLFPYLLTILLVGLSSCKKNDNYFDPQYNIDRDTETYRTKFKTQFGETILPDHPWGFTSMSISGDTMPKTIEREGLHDPKWESKFLAPAPIDSVTAKKVAEYIRTHAKDPNYTLNWENYFLQHVFKSSTVYVDEKTGEKIVGSDAMVSLNINSTNSRYTVTDFKLENGSMQCVSNTVPSDFYVKLVYTLGGEVVEKYTKNAKVFKYDGCYYVGVGFVEDEYYDWIFKISIAQSIDAKRVLCEDSGLGSGFDYNDVVFDVGYYRVWPEEKNARKGIFANITLQAAGGTFSLYVGEKEIHESFGLSHTNTMINTGRGVSLPPVNYEYCITTNPLLYDELTADNVPVKLVMNKGKTDEYVRLLKMEKGVPPYKICVPVTVEWPTEDTSIEFKYPLFTWYLTNKNVEFWKNQ